MDATDLIFSFFFLILFGAMGLCLGSFSTAIIYRERTGQSWFQYKGHASRSFCPHCQSSLGVRDLVPVFSWIFLKGKCRHCQVAISGFYPAVELTCCIGALVIYFLSGLSMLSFTALFCLPFIVSLIYLGIVHKNFSWRLVIIVGVIGLAAFFLQIFTLE